ncbi:polysaccharide deacetylase family protein [Kitasatospora sp. NPDC092948]|uniref:polysaccharide deacetylase family protein n=1 Tax=Kitasatospora sp. NPDC092948 TaxID=3364088 RepID=UPI0038200D82
MVKSRITARRRPLLLGVSAALLAPAVLAACGAHGTPLAAGGAAQHSASPSASTSTAPSGSGSSSAAARPTPGGVSPSPFASPDRTAPAAAGSAGPTGAAATTPPAAPATTPPAGAGAAPKPADGHQTPAPATHVLAHTASGGRTVALTFDDGPGPATGQVLDLLAQYDAKATFCEIGNNAKAHPAAVKRILAEGHRLCDHTVDHPQPMHTQSHERQVAEIADAKAQIVDAAGGDAQITWWRAPGGDFTAENEQIGADQGMKSLGWSVDPRDWSRPGVQSIVHTVQQNLRPGGVVLMHDGGGDRTQTVAALKQLLPWLVAQGYTFDFPQS